MSLPGLRTKALPGQRAASRAPLSGTELSHLTTLLAPNFLPASMSQPPTADPNNTGGRIIAVTTSTQNTPKVTDSAVIALGAGGQLDWSFTANFTVPPTVTVTPEGAPPSAGTTVFVVSPVETNGVVVKSTDSTDRRSCHMQAEQPSQGD